jgi:hypothetical protein
MRSALKSLHQGQDTPTDMLQTPLSQQEHMLPVPPHLSPLADGSSHSVSRSRSGQRQHPPEGIKQSHNFEGMLPVLGDGSGVNMHAGAAADQSVMHLPQPPHKHSTAPTGPDHSVMHAKLPPVLLASYLAPVKLP